MLLPTLFSSHINFLSLSSHQVLHYALIDVSHHLVRELEVMYQLSFEEWPELLIGYNSPREETVDLFNFKATLPLAGTDIFQSDDGTTWAVITDLAPRVKDITLIPADFDAFRRHS